MYRPLSEGLCRVESYKDGTLDLCDIADLNDLLDVRQENQRRYRAAVKDYKP